MKANQANLDSSTAEGNSGPNSAPNGGRDVILKIEGLQKSFRSYWTYQKRPAVREVSLEVYQNEAFGFLGGNGAGKTTTIKCITGIVHKNAGDIYLCGEKLTRPEQKRILGYLPEQPYFYDHLSVEETLSFFGALHGLTGKVLKAKVAELLERVELSDRRRSRVRALSKGLQQRLGFAGAIINDPKLLILDEPFSGLDPVGRRLLRNLIIELKASGTSIFMSSHILNDVEEICDRVCILKAGKLVSSFHIADCAELFGERLEIRVQGLMSNTSLLEQCKQNCISIKPEPSQSGDVSVLEVGSYNQAQQILKELLQNDLKLLSFRSGGISLEEVFVKLTEQAT